MELTTIQSYRAFQTLIKNGSLETDTGFINLKKYQYIYSWVVRHMEHTMPAEHAEYPLWCWVRYGKIACPLRHTLAGYFGDEDIVVKITFNKPKEELFITDYKLFHFVIANEYLPSDRHDYERFQAFMRERGVTQEELRAYVRRDRYPVCRTDAEFLKVNSEVEKSFDAVMSDSGEYLQATFWKLDVTEIKRVEFLHRSGCIPKNDKKALDYRKEYIKSL